MLYFADACMAPTGMSVDLLKIPIMATCLNSYLQDLTSHLPEADQKAIFHDTVSNYYYL